MADPTPSESSEKPTDAVVAAPAVGSTAALSGTPEQVALADDEIYQERTVEEVAVLTDGFKRTPFGGYNYVAEPAPGHDVSGIWHCFHTDSRSGYAAHAVAISWMIAEELKIPLMLVPHRAKDIDVDRFPEDRDEMFSRWHSHKRAVGLAELLIVSLPPELQMSGVAGRMIYYSAYEATKVSKFVADTCNSDAMSAIWCVSDFVRYAFEASDVKPSKLDTIRPMLCGGPWTFPDLDQLVANKRPDFTFGTMGTWHDRKGFHHLVRAYFGEFKRSEQVVLNIRTSIYGNHKTIREFTESVVAEIAEIAKDFGDADFPRSKKMPRIHLQTGTDMTDAEVIRWLGTLDGYVAPSFGEGLGIPAIWAKAMGTPLTATGFGALGDLIEEVDNLIEGDTRDRSIGYTLVSVPAKMQAISPMFTPDALWANYEPRDLGVAMRAQMVDRTKDIAGARVTRELFGPKTLAPLSKAIYRRTGGALGSDR